MTATGEKPIALRRRPSTGIDGAGDEPQGMTKAQVADLGFSSGGREPGFSLVWWAGVGFEPTTFGL